MSLLTAAPGGSTVDVWLAFLGLAISMAGLGFGAATKNWRSFPKVIAVSVLVSLLGLGAGAYEDHSKKLRLTRLGDSFLSALHDEAVTYAEIRPLVEDLHPTDIEIDEMLNDLMSNGRVTQKQVSMHSKDFSREVLVEVFFASRPPSTRSSGK